VTGEAFGFHDFRHFRITFLATSEVARWISEAWVGHKRKKTVETQRPTSFLLEGVGLLACRVGPGGSYRVRGSLLPDAVDFPFDGQLVET
jgi:hypothetical protein